MAERGKFIVLEGIDGSGKSTQMENLIPSFLIMDEWVVQTREPYDEPENEIGFRIRQILLGKEKNPGYSQLQQMFVEARKWHLDNIVIPVLEQGVHVISDRYTASTYAYHRSKGGTFREVKEWHRDCDCPADVTIWIKISPEDAVQRLDKRGGLKELFEKEQSLQAIYNAYEELFLYDHAMYVPNFKLVDGSQEPDDVNRDIVRICGELISGLDREGVNQ